MRKLLIFILIAGCSTATHVRTKVHAVSSDCRFSGPGKVKKMIQCHRKRAKMANELIRGNAIVWRSRTERTGIDSSSTDFAVCIGDREVCQAAKAGENVAGVVVVTIGPVTEQKRGIVSLIRDALSLVGIVGLIYFIL